MFFRDEEIKTQAVRRYDLKEGSPNCMKCGLYRFVKSPRMLWSGKGGMKCLQLAEAPGNEEDERGEQFVGEAGSLWENHLMFLGLDLNRDFWKDNSIKCRPFDVTPTGTKNRTPKKEEIEHCYPLLEETIRRLKPRFIWLLGGKAVEAFYLNVPIGEKTINRFRGLCIPDRRWNCWVLPLFHPSYLLRQQVDNNLQSVFRRDLENAAVKLNLGDIPPLPKENIIHLTDYTSLINFLDKIISEKSPIVIDFETLGYKPYYPEMKIVSISISPINDDTSYAFPLDYNNFWHDADKLVILGRLREILEDQEILKIAQNIKFEHVWAAVALNIIIKGWYWDTMLASHIQDNRSQFTSLTFQTFINFGREPYDTEMERYKRAQGKSQYNSMDKCPLTKLLDYNALDSHYTRLLLLKQEKEFDKDPGLIFPRDFFFEGTLKFADLEMRGMNVDEDYIEKMSNSDGTGTIDKEIQTIKKELSEGEESKRFFQVKRKTLDINSTKDLGELFYNILGHERIYTEKDNLSVDKNALSLMKSEFAEKLLRYRTLEKVRGTYLAQFKRYVYKGMIHPFFDLVIPVTYRSSSSKFNFHNQPKRDKQAQEWVRKAVKPRKGHGILSSDFSGIEVGISACYNKDPNLIAYVSDKSKDMHRDSACDLWMLPKEEIEYWIRFYAKNCWVFPQFYGDYYVGCARNLWRNCLLLKTNSGIILKDHLYEKGIKRYEEFEEHCKEQQDIFWGTRFPIYKQWKEDIQIEYQEKGYIESYLGFRFSGYMRRNELTNYQTQGTAFHVLLWTLIEVMNVAEEEGWDTHAFGQIHDDMLHDWHPDELDHVIETINYCGTQRVREEFDWIVVPLRIDHEVSEIDGNWFEMEEKHK